MTVEETALVFDCGPDKLVGILSRVTTAPTHDLGVVIVVGGPQYRAGSHRQFVLLARALAAQGFSTLRFDVRGMGDSPGDLRSFEDLDDDVSAAIEAMTQRCPEVRRVALWGLCDGASAALLYLDRKQDRRVVGVCLLNPWVRTEVGLARAQVKYYYLNRLADRAFWAKLFAGAVGRQAVRDLLASLQASFFARPTPPSAAALPFQQRMARAWRHFDGEMLLVLSGADLVAREFVDHAGSDAAWRGLLQFPNVCRVDLPSANHTFTDADHKKRVEDETALWLCRMTSNASSSTVDG